MSYDAGSPDWQAPAVVEPVEGEQPETAPQDDSETDSDADTDGSTGTIDNE